MPRPLYSLLLRALLPVAAVWFICRGWRHPAYRGSLRERLALGQAPRTDRPLWLHAASVGELRALAALLPAMGREAPLLVTVGTPTGLARARELFAGETRVSCIPAPWDLPGAARRFLDAARPRAAIIVETELWPNLIAAAHQRGVRLALVSARLSPRSLRGYRRWAPRLMRATVRAFAVIGAQGEADRARFIELGAEPARVRVTGNLKFDLPLDAQLPARGAALRARWAGARPLWVAGSTHPGEEAVLVQAQQHLLQSASERGASLPLLALAPRRPERFDAVAAWLASRGLTVARTAAGGRDNGGAAAQVVLIDEMGVLHDWYAAADAAFVGGSLVPVGGHNLLEPAALGRPVLTGPHAFNAPDVARCLIEAGGAREVRDATALAAILDEWLRDAGAAARVGARAAAAVAAHRGAAARTAALLTGLAAVPGPAPSASG